jgi:hypothetical protein
MAKEWCARAADGQAEAAADLVRGGVNGGVSPHY